jgi:hypothetical protein
VTTGAGLDARSTVTGASSMFENVRPKSSL